MRLIVQPRRFQPRWYQPLYLALLLTTPIACTKPICENTEEKVRLRLNAMAESAYNHGCLNAYIRLCHEKPSLTLRSQCQDEGVIECEKGAKGFQDWLGATKAQVPTAH